MRLRCLPSRRTPRMGESCTRRRRVKNMRWPIALLTAFLCLFLAMERSRAQVAATQTAATQTIVGEQKAIGKGTVRTWVKLDMKTREPRSIGVTLTETGLTGLPADKD